MAVMWSRLNTFLLLLVLLVLGGIVGVLATRIESGPLDPSGPPSVPTDSVRLPGRPITGPTTIDERGHYYLTRNINSGLGIPIITISVGHVTLDLNGFSLGGADVVGSTGILFQGEIEPPRNVLIRNGTVTDFRTGINAAGAESVRIEDVRLISNHRGVELGVRSLLTRCSVQGGTEHGVFVASTGSSNTVRECQIIQNGGNGIRFDGANNLIVDSYVMSNAAGFDVNFVGNKNVVRDSYLGQVAISGQTNVVMDNACITSTSNGGGISNIISPADHPNVTCFP
jgi:hypothetical protein